MHHFITIYLLKKISIYSNKWHHYNKHNMCVINSHAHVAHQQLRQIVFFLNCHKDAHGLGLLYITQWEKPECV